MHLSELLIWKRKRKATGYIWHHFLLKSKYAKCIYSSFSSETSFLILSCASGGLLPEGAISWHYCSGERSFPTKSHSGQEANLGGSSQVWGYPKSSKFAFQQCIWDMFIFLSPRHQHNVLSAFFLPPPCPRRCQKIPHSPNFLTLR